MHKHLTKLVVAAVVALVLAFWAGNSRKPQETAAQQPEVVPGLKEAVNDVKTIRVIGAENKPIVTLNRSETGWVVAERNGFAADVSKVREYLLKLADATLVEPKTSLPESYAKLGVEDIAGKDAKGAQLELEGLKTPVKLIVGNFNGRGGDGTFVRRAGEAQSWLAQGNLTVDKSVGNWLKRDLADIGSNRIAEVSIAAGDKTLRVYKSDANQPNYAVADVPKGREVSSEFVANGLASVLSGLRFDDVVPADQAQPGDAKVFNVKYTAFDGLSVSAQAWEREGKDYGSFTASLDEARAATHVSAEQAKAKSEYEAQKASAEAKAAEAAKSAKPEDAKAAPVAAPTMPEAPLAVTDAAKDSQQRLDALRKEVADLNARFKGWTFVLPSYKFANMNKSIDDMLKPLETKKPDAKAPAAGKLPTPPPTTLPLPKG